MSEEQKENELQCRYRVVTKVTEFINNNRLNPSLRFIDEELQKNKYGFLYAEKAKILRLMKKSNDAVLAIEVGLFENAIDYKLLTLKADILANDFLNTNDVKVSLQEAQHSIELAKKYFDEQHKNFRDEIAIIVNAGLRVADYTSELIEIRNIENNIKHLSSLYYVYSEINKSKEIVQQTEDRIFTDRIRTIEILGLFVGIFAFIISSAQISVNYQMVEAISIIIAMGMVLLVFLFVLHLAFNKYERSWLYIILIFIFLIIAMFIVPLLPDIIKGLKYKFGII